MRQAHDGAALVGEAPGSAAARVRAQQLDRPCPAAIEPVAPDRRGGRGARPARRPPRGDRSRGDPPRRTRLSRPRRSARRGSGRGRPTARRRRRAARPLPDERGDVLDRRLDADREASRRRRDAHLPADAPARGVSPPRHLSPRSAELVPHAGLLPARVEPLPHRRTRHAARTEAPLSRVRPAATTRGDSHRAPGRRDRRDRPPPRGRGSDPVAARPRHSSTRLTSSKRSREISPTKRDGCPMTKPKPRSWMLVG